MNTTVIGKNILELRKAKGITQETLANEVGVTSQAVSKWETGGAPDLETVILIADYFEVSVDRLFGRNVNDYGKLEDEIVKHIISLPHEQRIKKAIDYCWAIEIGIVGGSNMQSLDEITRKEKCKIYSQAVTDHGFTIFSIYKDLRYFLLMPEPNCGWQKELGFKEDYISLFNFLGDTNVLKTIYFLFGRDNKPFTPRLIEENIGIQYDKALDILKRLKEYRLIKTSEIELDDEMIEVYKFEPNPAFLAVLAVVKLVIDKPNVFHGYLGGREKPFLQNDLMIM